MSKQFPVSFNFRAFESVSGTIDKLNGKFETLKAKTTGINNRFAVLQAKTKSARKFLEDAGERISGVGKRLSVFVTAPLALAGAKFLQTAVEAEETSNRFNQTFKGVEDAAKTGAIDTLRNQYQLSTQSAQDFLSKTGLLTKDLGFSSEKALEMSTRLAGLSIAVSSFRKVEGGAERVSEAFNAALAGNTRGLKELGIVIDDSKIRAQAMEMAQRGVTFETVRQAKALAILELIQKSTKSDVEDFKNSAHEFSNQLRILREKMISIATTIGNILKPIAASALSIFNKLADAFLGLSPATQKMIVIFAALAAALGPILIAVGGFLALLPAMITGFSLLTAASLPLILTVLGIVAALGALITIGILVVRKWEPIKAFFIGLWEQPKAAFLGFLETIRGAFGFAGAFLKTWEPVKNFFGEMGAKLGGAISPTFGQKSETLGAKPIGEKAEGAGMSQAQVIGREIAKEIRVTNDARVQVDFGNMPRGTRVSSEASGMMPTLNLGFAGAPI